MYTPNLKPSNIQRLYHYAKRVKSPMTRALNTIVETALDELEQSTSDEEEQSNG